MQVPNVQTSETETLSGKVGAFLGKKSMLLAECGGNNLASLKFSFLSGPSL